ncbi:MAG: hypothetical protein AAF456_08570 [Planctomycetota bacterium]
MNKRVICRSAFFMMLMFAGLVAGSSLNAQLSATANYEVATAEQALDALVTAIVVDDPLVDRYLTSFLLATEGAVRSSGSLRDEQSDPGDLNSATGGVILAAPLHGKEVSGLALYQVLPTYRVFNAVVGDATPGELLKIGVRRGKVYAEIGTVIVSSNGTARLTLIDAGVQDPLDRPVAGNDTILPPPFIPQFENDDFVEIWSDDGQFLASGRLDDNE